MQDTEFEVSVHFSTRTVLLEYKKKFFSNKIAYNLN